MDAITKAELARRLNISKPRVSQLVHAGMPVLPDGKIDAAVALDWIARRTDPSHQIGRRQRGPKMPVAPQPARPAAHPAVDTATANTRFAGDAGSVLLMAKAKRAIADAKKAERLERFAAGELREAREMVEFASTVGHIIQDHMLSQAERLAPAVAAMSDVDAIFRLIRNDANAMLRRFSKAIADAGAE